MHTIKLCIIESTEVKRLKQLILLASIPLIISCSQDKEDSASSLNTIAQDYVRLGLFIGQYDTDFVDAYYGPDSLKPKTKPELFPKDSVLSAIAGMRKQLDQLIARGNDSTSVRAKWMSGQLTAFTRRVKIFTGEYGTFDEESTDLFGVKAPEYPASHYEALIDSLDKTLPGSGSVQDRFQALANRFIIPKAKLDTVFKTTIAEARARTLAHYKLPAEEKFSLEYVTNKSWSGYNWYKGNYTSEIQINTDIQIFIERAIDVGSHESYPGHHVYNMLLEKNLYRDKGWVEISLYPLFSPQSFIAEGSANYGIELAFPGQDKVRFSKEVILPLAGLDTAGIGLYFKALSIRGKLNYARNEAGRGIVNATMNDEQALDWLKKYCLYNEETALKSISFIKKYRSYVINYNYGQDVVKSYIEKGAANGHWDVFSNLLSNPVSPRDLIK
ncbi:hypothetical protein SAMN05661099_2105 [Daejeonella lutea]|uniref:DUF885 domain-containing protein n=1 Tax=Daejeonella lutea TaxID=572036 RepID=A0A1T5D1C6_9SPHI|nr:hypothetical protein SAMN05661099_2105 [Daejeonella lutea]